MIPQLFVCKLIKTQLDLSKAWCCINLESILKDFYVFKCQVTALDIKHLNALVGIQQLEHLTPDKVLSSLAQVWKGDC